MKHAQFFSCIVSNPKPTTMAFTLASVVLALASSATAASVPSPSSSSVPSCTATLNGKLPNQTPINFHPSGHVRQYYIAAEEITWDHAPSAWDNWLGVPLDTSPRAQKAGYTKYGTKWRKAVFRGYEDSSFTTKSPQPEWQGIQGPTIRAEVGDLVEILFVNKLQHHYASMHSMGLAYSKEYEGSDYPNGTHTKIALAMQSLPAIVSCTSGSCPTVLLRRRVSLLLCTRTTAT